MRLKSFIASSLIKKAIIIFVFLTVVAPVVIHTPVNIAQAKVSTEVVNLIKEAISKTQRAATSISATAYIEADSELTTASGNVRNALSKTTDQNLKKNLSLDVAKIENAKQLISVKEYNQALKTTQQVATSLQTHLDAAEGGSTTTTTNSDTGSTTNTDNSGGGSSGGSGGAGLSNDQINSNTDAVPGASFDTVLGTFSNLLEFESVPELIIRLINILLMLAGMIAVLVIIVGGFNLVTAAGNESKVTKGRQSIMWAVAGLVLCLMSFSIVAIIQKIIS